MFATIHLLIFGLFLLIYFLISLALLYHWLRYTVSPVVFLYTSIIYLGITAPLIMVMLVTVLNINN